VKDKKARS